MGMFDKIKRGAMSPLYTFDKIKQGDWGGAFAESAVGHDPFYGNMWSKKLGFGKLEDRGVSKEAAAMSENAPGTAESPDLVGINPGMEQPAAQGPTSMSAQPALGRAGMSNPWAGVRAAPQGRF